MANVRSIHIEHRRAAMLAWPDHAKCFKVAAVVNDETFAPAWGRNKKEAEQHAACNALAQVENRPIPHPSE